MNYRFVFVPLHTPGIYEIWKYGYNVSLLVLLEMKRRVKFNDYIDLYLIFKNNS